MLAELLFFSLFFFCTLQFLSPSCLIRISKPRITIPSASTHMHGGVFFFLTLFFLIYHASAVLVTSPSSTVWSACLDLDGGRPLVCSFFTFFECIEYPILNQHRITFEIVSRPPSTADGNFGYLHSSCCTKNNSSSTLFVTHAISLCFTVFNCGRLRYTEGIMNDLAWTQGFLTLHFTTF